MTNTGILIGIFCYFGAIVLVGYLLRNRNKGAEDFLVGGRSFGVLFNSGALIACFMGGAMIIGIPGMITTFGFWNSDAKWGGLIPLGAVLCLILAGLFYMRKLWELKLLSLGDYFYQRFGRQAGFTATILMCFTFTIWIAVQIISFAKVGVSLIGLSLPVWIIISMTVICCYTVLGGLWAICITDVIQVSLVTISVLILTPYIVCQVGGWDSFLAGLPREKLEFLPKYHGLHDWLPWIAAPLITGLGSIASPDLMQRAFSAKTAAVARNSALLAALFKLFLTLVIIILSFATLQLMARGGMDSSFMAKDPELLIPMAFQALLPAPLVVIFLGAVLAAVMSAAATSNLALAGVISKNLVKDFFLPEMGSRALMQLTRAVVVCIGILGAYIAIALPSAFLLVTLGFDLIFSCLFVPLTFGLYWNKANGWGAVCSMIFGAAFRIIGSGLVNGFSLAGIGSPTETWYIFTLGGPAASLVGMIAGSLLTRKIDLPTQLTAVMDKEKEAETGHL